MSFAFTPTLFLEVLTQATKLNSLICFVFEISKTDAFYLIQLTTICLVKIRQYRLVWAIIEIYLDDTNTPYLQRFELTSDESGWNPWMLPGNLYFLLKASWISWLKLYECWLSCHALRVTVCNLGCTEANVTRSTLDKGRINKTHKHPVKTKTTKKQLSVWLAVYSLIFWCHSPIWTSDSKINSPKFTRILFIQIIN